MKRILSYIILLILCQQTHAQYFDLGQDPASLHWKKINTEHFRIIFPEDYASESKRLACLLETAYPVVGQSLHHQPRSIPVILHNHSITSNGIVSWAPKRLEIYPTPPQGIYPQDWLEQIVLHELRHVVQLDKMKQGFTKGLNFVLGQQATAAITGLFVPSWFLEGDAVATETAFSKTGRGSLPLFEAEERAQLMAEGILPYDKAVFGSFADPMPDRYVMGYFFVAGARMRHGPEIWDKALDYAARRPYLLTPFSKGIRKLSGLTKDRLYSQVFEHLDSLWQANERKLDYTPLRRLDPLRNTYHSEYHFPTKLDDGSVFAFHKSLDHIPHFIRFFPGQEERVLYTPGNVMEDAISFQDGKIIWAEEVPDARWENRSFAVVRIYDTLSGKLTTLGRRSRYFAPSPSPDGSKIAVTETSPGGVNSLVVLDAVSGERLQKISSPEKLLFLTPVWSGEGDKILAAGLGAKGKTILETNLTTGQTRMLLPYTHTEINGPVYYDNRVLFVGGYNGIDNIYSLDTSSGEIIQVLSARYGAKDINFTLQGDSLLFAEFEHGGHKIGQAAFSPGAGIPLKKIKKISTGLDSALRKQEAGALWDESNAGNNPAQAGSAPWDTITIRPYHKLAGLFNFHSWSPFMLDADNMELRPGIQVLSQNLLSTSFLSAGIDYLRFEDVWRYHVDYSYRGFYPVIDFSVSDGLRGTDYQAPGALDWKKVTWKERKLEAGLRIPFNLTRNKFYRFFQPYVTATLDQIAHTSSTPAGFFHGKAASMEYGLEAYRLLRYNDKDLQPPFGQWIRLTYRHSPFGDLDRGYILGTEAYIFLPGIFPNHGIRINAGWQRRGLENSLSFDDLIFSPRGYEDATGKVFRVLSVNYSLPLFYPDLSLPYFMYVKRLKATFFTDYAQNQRNDRRYDFNSLGADLSADLHLFRFYAPVELGLRSVYIPKSRTLLFELLYGINFSSF